MPVDITDVDTFTDPIVGPADSDPADATYVLTVAQGNGNRTRYLHNRVVAYGGLFRSSITADTQSINATPSKLTLFDAELGADGVQVVNDLANDEITVSANGVYEVHASLSFKANGATIITLRLFVEGAASVLRSEVVIISGDETQQGLSGFVELNADDVLDLRVSTGGSTLNYQLLTGSTFWLRRIA